jgi:hypothetical protein
MKSCCVLRVLPVPTTTNGESQNRGKGMKAQDDKGPADNQADSSEPDKPPSAFEAAKGGELATLQR